ncbi:MAG: M48 family metalloprotease [Myxococcales bacterium]|nr:M48 family metalloprotease [Myxococcales bacterium]
MTGQRELVLMSPEREASVGKQAAAQVAEQIGLVEAPALTAYIDQIGQRLAAFSPRKDVQYRFAVADMPEPNAFALPGGYIYVSRGLLALSNSEAELANVIGHEIGHVAARHSAQRETRAMGVGLLGALGTVLAGVAGGAQAAQSVGQLTQVAGAGLIASYGRDQERQSDDLGQRMAAAAGWDPNGMPFFLRSLEKDFKRRSGGEDRRPSFLDSHPVTGERVAATRERASGLRAANTPPIARGRDAYLRRLEGLQIGPDPAEGIFQEQRFLHPEMDFTLLFPEGWMTQNGKTAVAGMSAKQDAMIILELQGPSGDPAAAANQFAQQKQIQFEGGSAIRIGGRRAYRALTKAQVQGGAAIVELTWIDHPAGMFRVQALAPEQSYSSYASVFRRTAESFRGLTAAERSSIVTLHLGLASARQGESLAAFSTRTRNAWSLAELAVVNGVEENARLSAGELMKVAIPSQYR